MNSVPGTFKPAASGDDAPKQLHYLPPLKLSDGNEIPLVRPSGPPVMSDLGES